jgi:archaetidylinositol phosphate synthase
MLIRYKHLFKAPTERIALVFHCLGMSPNGLSIGCLVLGLGVCGFYVWNQNSVLFGCLILGIGLFDLIDGALARATDRVTKFGAYLDAVCDRFLEGAAVLSVAYVSGEWVLCWALAVGGQLISYTKARAAMEVPIVNDEWPDFMERFERSVIFLISVILWGIFPEFSVLGQSLLIWLLVPLCIAVYSTVFQRMIRAKRIMESRH